MSTQLVALVVGAVFLTLLLAGRAKLARSTSSEAANGAVLLVLAILVGAWFLGLVASWDMW